MPNAIVASDITQVEAVDEQAPAVDAVESTAPPQVLRALAAARAARSA